MRTLLAIFMLPLLVACGTKTPLKLPPATTARMALDTADTVAINDRDNALRAVSSAPTFLEGNHNNNAAEHSRCV
jgi:predicted small lipoprotein YifL